MFWCKECLVPSTRPRIAFKDGICNACWHHKTKIDGTINWKERWQELTNLCNKYRHVKPFNVVVPVSGGKDSTFVAWNLKYHPDLRMNPLTVTFREPMPTLIGKCNLENFILSGFDHIFISPNQESYRKYNKDWFISQGMPKQAFVCGISTSVLRLAIQFDIPFIMWGEYGEAEYGGKDEHLMKSNRDFLINIYYEGQDNCEKYGPWWKIPEQQDLDKIVSTWYSYFVDWDPEEHAKFAKEKVNFQTQVGGSIGTFTNYSQLSCCLQDLHCYLMFLKFGFGRCTSDASIEIRRGRLSREEGVKAVNALDGQFPVEYLEAYLGYFEMTPQEFWEVIDNFANRELLERTGRIEKPWILKEPVC